MGIFDSVSQLFSAKRAPLVVKPKQKPPKQHTVVADTQAAQQILKAAQTESQAILIDAKDEALRIKRQAQDELRIKEEQIDRRLGAFEERERLLTDEERRLNEQIAHVDEIKTEQLAKLERVAHLTREEAKQLILAAVEEKLKEDVAKRVREAEENAREDADKKAREILVEAMRHGATDYVAEYTMSSVKLPDEEMKGRIIGKEGRNI
ncbi:MAG: Rnase Y domain-containing protein, partial [Patescibacteria group bacterium]